MISLPGFSARQRQPGFTLIELLIVLVIVGLLAGVAYPTYSNYLKRSARADARAELLRMQLAVEKQRVAKMGAVPVLPTTWITTAAVTKHYQLSLQPNGAQDYQLMAQANAGDAQANDEQAGVSCSQLMLVVKGLDTRYEPAICWQQ